MKQHAPAVRGLGGYFFDELQAILPQGRRAIPPGTLVEKLARRVGRQPFPRQRRTQEVATEVLHSVSGLSGDGDSGVKGCER